MFRGRPPRRVRHGRRRRVLRSMNGEKRRVWTRFAQVIVTDFLTSAVVPSVYVTFTSGENVPVAG